MTDEPEATDEGCSGVVREREVEQREYEHGDRAFRRRQLGDAAGGEQLGASVYEVPPGKRTFLAHYHTANEEALYVLDGEGTLYLGPDRGEHALEPGVYAALTADESGTHEIEAGEETLRFLMVSTMNEPEVIVYPEDGKVNVYAGEPPGGDSEARTLSKTLDIDAEAPYWDDD